MDYKYKLDYPLIAKRIKAARSAAGLTQEQLAEKINKTPNAVAKLEVNLMKPSLRTLINIANVLGIDLNYLLSDSSASEEDLLFDGLVGSLTPKDKLFLIHVIKGLKMYNSEDKE